MTRLFRDPEAALAAYPDVVINRGLWSLVGASGDLDPMLEAGLPWDRRARAIASIFTLFERLFVPRCSDHLGHRSQEGSPLNSICYMWWDVFPTWGQPGDPEAEQRDRVLLSVMGRVLELDSLPCQESALHGLGHWRMHYAKECAALIDGYLLCVAGDSDLAAYARAARDGCIQ